MKRSFALELALATAALMPAAAHAQPSDSKPVTWHGACEYGDQVAQYLDGNNGFALCDAVVFTRRGAHATFDFRQEGTGSTARYEGELDGDRLEVAILRLGELKPRGAQGDCTLHHRDGEISGVTCTATADGMGYGANFVRRD